jgi:hypothetical protein
MSTPKTSRPLNVSYLVVGLIFLGISGSWALNASGAVDNADVQWLMPLVLVGAGVIGLVAFTAKGLTRGRGEAVADQEPGLDLYGAEPYETEHTQTDYAETEHTETQTGTEIDQPEQTTRIEGEDR